MRRRMSVLALALAACHEPSSGDELVAPAAVAPVEVEVEAHTLESRWVDLAIADRDDGSTTLACAVEAGGALWCWGSDPSFDSRHRLRSGPVEFGSRYAPPSRVRGVTQARAVALSWTHLCRADLDGRVRCLDNEGGSWWEVAGVEGAVELFVADHRGCALEDDAELRCWDRRAPARLVRERVIDAFHSSGRGCTLEHDGTIACWRQAVQLDSWVGNPSVVDRRPGARDIAYDSYMRYLWIIDGDGWIRRRSLDDNADGEWTAIEQVADAVEIVVHRYHECVRTSSGRVLCRGRNSHGQLGDGTSIARDRFAPVAVEGARELALGELRSCAATAEDIVCAGLDGGALRVQEPLRQHTLPDLRARSLAAHGPTTCAIDDGDALRCWGSAALDDSYQSIESFGVEQAATPTLVREGVAELRGLWTHEGMITWVSEQGRLEHALWKREPTPTLALFDLDDPAMVRTPGSIRQLVAGLVACTLEVGKRGDVLACDRDPRRRRVIPGIKAPVLAVVGFRTLCAIDRRSRVWCATTPDLYEESAKVEPARVAGVERAVGLAANSGSACALIDDGRVRCWSTRAGERWRGETMTLLVELGPASDIGLVDVAVIASGEGSDYCSLDRAGAVRCWSPDVYSGGLDERQGPELDGEQVELVAGSNHFCARARAGQVTCWGDERHAQLGRVPPEVSLVPTPLRFADDA